MKYFLNKNIFLLSIGGCLLFVILSSLHDGLGSERTLESFYLPVITGFILGTIIGIMKSSLDVSKKKNQQSLINIIEILSNSLNERDKYTYGHARRVTNLAMILGNTAGLNNKEFEQLRLGAIMHDIGKIGVQDSILLKSGKLSDEEFEQIKQHPVQGEYILQPMMQDAHIVKIIQLVRHHHERYDGAGYPDGLKGEEIPLLARIIAIADSFDAMTSDRPYRKGMSKEKALSEIQKGAGTQYDSSLATNFVSMMQRYGESECPSLLKCSIFPLIKEHADVSVAYNVQFCHGLYRSCARYQTKLGENCPTNLLPDGGYFRS